MLVLQSSIQTNTDIYLGPGSGSVLADSLSGEGRMIRGQAPRAASGHQGEAWGTGAPLRGITTRVATPARAGSVVANVSAATVSGLERGRSSAQRSG